MKREERLNFIAELISKNEIKTQDELVALLLNYHVDVTQATVSRDIKTLDLVKIPAQSGGYCYALPKTTEGQTFNLSQQDLVYQSISEIKLKNDMLALHANPGTTSLIKSHLLAQFEQEIFTVVIDDDSVLAIFVTSTAARNAYDLLNN